MPGFSIGTFWRYGELDDDGREDATNDLCFILDANYYYGGPRIMLFNDIVLLWVVVRS